MRSDVVRLSEILEMKGESPTKSALTNLRRQIRTREVMLGTQILIIPGKGPARVSLSQLRELMPDLLPDQKEKKAVEPHAILREQQDDIDELHEEIARLKEGIEAFKSTVLAKFRELRSGMK